MAKKTKRAKVGYMISAVAEKFHLHPQTLRLYEREGLVTPSRSEGNTRLYTEEDVERLEVILNMRGKMEDLTGEMEEFVGFVNQELERMRDRALQERFRTALVRLSPRARPEPEKAKAS